MVVHDSGAVGGCCPFPVDLDEVTAALLDEGVEKFEQAFAELLTSIEQSVRTPASVSVSTLHRSLPNELAAQVDAVVEQWSAGGKVARLWAHDATLWTGADEASWLGWLGVAMDQLAHAHRFTALVNDVRAGGFRDAVLLGMGGSSLCPEVLSLTFSSQTAGLPRLRVLDSTVPQQIKTLEDELDLSRTLFFVSSKSGTTLEPNIFAAYFHARVADLLGAEEAGRRFIAITDSGSPLQDLAERDGYRAVFHGLSSIGGRYSALSDFGMIPGAACGVDVMSLLDNAERMAHACAACVPARENPGLALGALIGVCANAGRDKLTLITSSGIREAAPRTPGRTGEPTSAEHGYLHCGPNGAGHFVKMVHNGIEYGAMAAYAEGLNILKHANAGKVAREDDAETAPLEHPEDYPYDLDLAAVTEVWRRGSVIASWLLDLTAASLVQSPTLEDFSGRVSDSGEGRWTAIAAIEEGVPAPVLLTALFSRFDSRDLGHFANQTLSAMRSQFGGHIEKPGA
jgi:6-phosphogluconate dehydrogenase (decarboxylating)